MDEYRKVFDSKNVTFFCDPNIKSGCTSFKFDLTKEYLKEFLISSSPPSFNKFVHESIINIVKTGPTLRAMRTQDKYLRNQNSIQNLIHLHTSKPYMYLIIHLQFI